MKMSKLQFVTFDLNFYDHMDMASFSVCECLSGGKRKNLSIDLSHYKHRTNEGSAVIGMCMCVCVRASAELEKSSCNQQLSGLYSTAAPPSLQYPSLPLAPLILPI